MRGSGRATGAACESSCSVRSATACSNQPSRVRVPEARMIARWAGACTVAAALGASMSYFSVASGPPRLLADGVLIGTLGALALGPVVRRWYWVILSIIGLGLGVVAAVLTVLATGLALGFLGNDNPLYVGTIYGLGAVAAGLTASLVQSG